MFTRMSCCDTVTRTNVTISANWHISIQQIRANFFRRNHLISQDIHGLRHCQMRLLDVLIHGTPIGKDTITMNTRKLFAIMQRFTMCFQVGFPSESLAAFGTSVDFHDARMLFFPMTKQGSFGLEQFTTIGTSEIRHGAMILMVMCR